jgi:2-hydroxy-3-keto-5-methylthiopentenyl-1-phosphate phosphatase
MNDRSNYGLSDYGKSEITLSTTQGTDELSNDRMMDTFYHERTHSILDMMTETDLSNNEKFVDVFSKLLRQADETSEF